MPHFVRVPRFAARWCSVRLEIINLMVNLEVKYQLDFQQPYRYGDNNTILLLVVSNNWN